MRSGNGGLFGVFHRTIHSNTASVAERRATHLILDITGVQVVDTPVASAFVHAFQAVSLLNAQVLLTGIRPEVAQTLVGLGVDLQGIETRGTLQSGIAYAREREQRGERRAVWGA